MTSRQDEYQLVRMCTHDNCIVLPHWETKLHALWTDIPLIRIILVRIYAMHYLSYKCQVSDEEMTSINLISHCFDLTGNRTPYLPHGRPTLYRISQGVRSTAIIVWSHIINEPGWNTLPVEGFHGSSVFSQQRLAFKHHNSQQSTPSIPVLWLHEKRSILTLTPYVIFIITSNQLVILYDNKHASMNESSLHQPSSHVTNMIVLM